MKIHVVTYLHNNYGSILQAFALQSKLAELGAEPDLLIEMQTENHSSFLKILNFLRPKSNYSFFLRMKIRAQRRKFDAKIRKITEFKKRHFKILKLENFSFQLSNSDILIAGSDQIWSVLNGELSDWYTLRWCADSCIKKYSYAASLGYVDISAEQKEQFKTKLSDFVTISFREEQAAALFYDDFKGRVRCDIDPTLLYDGDFWKNLVSNNIRKKKYTVITDLGLTLIAKLKQLLMA